MAIGPPCASVVPGATRRACPCFQTKRPPGGGLPADSYLSETSALLDVFGLFGGVGLVGRRRARRRLLEAEGELVRLLVDRDLDHAALGQLAEEQLLGQRLLH